LHELRVLPQCAETRFQNNMLIYKARLAAQSKVPPCIDCSETGFYSPVRPFTSPEKNWAAAALLKVSPRIRCWETGFYLERITCYTSTAAHVIGDRIFCKKTPFGSGIGNSNDVRSVPIDLVYGHLFERISLRFLSLREKS
jgi:hypothetical protein